MYPPCSWYKEVWFVFPRVIKGVLFDSLDGRWLGVLCFYQSSWNRMTDGLFLNKGKMFPSLSNFNTKLLSYSGSSWIPELTLLQLSVSVGGIKFYKKENHFQHADNILLQVNFLSLHTTPHHYYKNNNIMIIKNNRIIIKVPLLFSYLI